MTTETFVSTWQDVLADYEDIGETPSKIDRILTFALYLLAEDGTFYGTADTMIESIRGGR